MQKQTMSLIISSSFLYVVSRRFECLEAKFTHIGATGALYQKRA